MTEEIFIMSSKEVERLKIIEQAINKKIKKKTAALMLGIGTRQLRNLTKAYKEHGNKGIISKKRNRISNRSYSCDLKENILKIIRENYHDFGPTLSQEYLLKKHNIKIGIETLRLWMISSGLWIPKKNKDKIYHPPRLRRENIGSLIQIDGSPHYWFEERGECCSLLVFIDDATSRIQLARFFPSETTFAYFEMVKKYLLKHGKPLSFYSDKHSIFRINKSEPESGTGLSQFGRAMQDLDIELIHANSPQAKGRVERVFNTLQNRLVKWLRIEGISNLASANNKIDEFIEEHNIKFSVQPKNKEDLHRNINNFEDIKNIFTVQEVRKVSKNKTIQYKNKIYQINVPGKGYRLRQSGVIVCEDSKGNITLLYKNQSLSYTVYDKNQHYSETVDSKVIAMKKIRPKKKFTPSPNHPWNIAARRCIPSQKRFF